MGTGTGNNPALPQHRKLPCFFIFFNARQPLQSAGTTRSEIMSPSATPGSGYSLNFLLLFIFLILRQFLRKKSGFL